MARRSEPIDPHSEVREANTQIRQTAKWMASAFAALAVVLLGALPLTELGHLTSETPVTRVAAASGGIVLGVLGIGIVLWFTSDVLDPIVGDFLAADKRPDITDRLFGPSGPIGIAYSDLKDSVKAADDALAMAGDPGTDEYRDALAVHEDWEETRQFALFLFGSELLRERFQRARIAIVVGLGATAIGLAAFAWGVNAPPAPGAPESASLAEAPTLLAIHLTSKGVDALAAARGCRLRELRALVIAGADRTREVVSVPSGRCASVRFFLTPDLGTPRAAKARSRVTR